MNENQKEKLQTLKSNSVPEIGINQAYKRGGYAIHQKIISNYEHCFIVPWQQIKENRE